MQVFVTSPDSGFPDVVFEATVESLVADAARAAGDEWGADADFLEISFAGSAMPSDSRLVSHGVEGGSQLTASLQQVFGLNWFTDNDKRKKLMQHVSNTDGQKHLSLDTPSFTTDGCFRFEMGWIPDSFGISFVNPHPSITSASFRETLVGRFGIYQSILSEDFLVSKIDLFGLKSITSTGDGFLSRCTSITKIDASCLSSLTTIGDRFLHGGSSLRTLNLSGLNNVTSIGNSFLSECVSLSDVDLSSLNSVTKIGHNFICNSSLPTVDLTGLNNVTEIGDVFLGYNQSLTAVDLSSLNNVTRIGDSFLAGCSSLSRVNVASLSPTSEVRKEIQEMGM